MLIYLNIAIALSILALGTHFASERRRIRRHAADVAAGSDQCVALARTLAGSVYARTRQLPDDPAFIDVPLLASLGATPVSVLRTGGCCSGSARLLICMLKSVGIRATQITLYHTSGDAVHALVEATCQDGTIVLDPTYGFSFHDEQGQPIGLERLRGGARPHFQSFSDSNRPAYPDDPYYDFDYASSRTANWTKSRSRQSIYRLANTFWHGGIDTLRQPAWSEWPQLVLMGSLAVVVGALNLVLAL